MKIFWVKLVAMAALGSWTAHGSGPQRHVVSDATDEGNSINSLLVGWYFAAGCVVPGTAVVVVLSVKRLWRVRVDALALRYSDLKLEIGCHLSKLNLVDPHCCCCCMLHTNTNTACTVWRTRAAVNTIGM